MFARFGQLRSIAGRIPSCICCLTCGLCVFNILGVVLDLGHVNNMGPIQLNALGLKSQNRTRWDCLIGTLVEVSCILCAVCSRMHIFQEGLIVDS